MSDTPCEVWFYHLERRSPEAVLPELLEKTLKRSWRALVRVVSQDRVDDLDGKLWTWRDDSFLPHGVEGEPMAAREPVLLTTGGENTNQADALFLLDGAEAGSLAGYERCIILFDGRDSEQLTVARTGWKTFKANGHAVSYWQEDDAGRWEKKG